MGRPCFDSWLQRPTLRKAIIAASRAVGDPKTGFFCIWFYRVDLDILGHYMSIYEYLIHLVVNL